MKFAYKCIALELRFTMEILWNYVKKNYGTIEKNYGTMEKTMELWFTMEKPMEL